MSQIASAQPVTNEDLERRLKVLEKKVATRPTAPVGAIKNVKSFLESNLALGGFFETGITALGQSHRDTQVAAASNTLGLNIAAEFDENIHFSSQILEYLSIPVVNQNSDPRGSAAGVTNQAEFQGYSYGSLLTQAFVDWSSSEAFNVQFGMGFAPYGYVLQQFELVLFVRRSGPQLLRTADLVFPFWQGINFHGAFETGNGRWGYNAYTFMPVANVKVPGVGTRLWWRSAQDNVTLGLSSQIAKRNVMTFQNFGADLRLHLDRFVITEEVSKSNGEGDQPWSTYLQTEYDLHDQIWFLYAFGDYLDNPNNLTANNAAYADPYRKLEYGAGVNWLPTSFTRFRLGVQLNKYLGDNATPSGQNRDYWNLDLSAGVAF